MMVNSYIKLAYRGNYYFLTYSKTNPRNLLNNIRFLLNANDYQMQRLARCSGFNDLREFVEYYERISDLSFQEILGGMELLCNILSFF